MKFWPVLVDFTLTSQQLFSSHVTMAANFEKFLISPGFMLKFGKSHQVSNSQLKSSESYGEKTETSMDRIGLSYVRAVLPQAEFFARSGIFSRQGVGRLSTKAIPLWLGG